MQGFLSKKFHPGTQSRLTKLKQDIITLINEFCKVWTQPVCYVDTVWCFYSPVQLSSQPSFPKQLGAFGRRLSDFAIFLLSTAMSAKHFWQTTCPAANTLHDTPSWGCLNMWLRVGRGDTLSLEDGSSIKWATEGKGNSLQTRRQVGRHLYLQFDHHCNHKHHANNKKLKKTTVEKLIFLVSSVNYSILQFFIGSALLQLAHHPRTQLVIGRDNQHGCQRTHS